MNGIFVTRSEMKITCVYWGFADKGINYSCEEYLYELRCHWWITITVLQYYQLLITDISLLQKCLLSVPSRAIQTKPPYFYIRIDAVRFDCYTEQVSKDSISWDIDRWVSISVSLITFKWKLFVKYDFVNNLMLGLPNDAGFPNTSCF